MTILICTGFYIYVIFSVNIYRKEIELRRKEGYAIKGKVKAPYPEDWDTELQGVIFFELGDSFPCFPWYY